MIKFDKLRPETIYNITVQAGTENGYGHILWGVYSTLAPGESHILRLLYRTPTTLTVAWEPVWPLDEDYVVSPVYVFVANCQNIPKAFLRKSKLIGKFLFCGRAEFWLKICFCFFFSGLQNAFLDIRKCAYCRP